jgi:hypothetical protein
MRSGELAAEMRQASLAMAPGDLRELVEAGVGPEDAGWLIGVMKISRIPDSQLFEPDDESGTWAYVTPIRVENPATPESLDPEGSVRRGALVDLVAWDPSVPHEWALRMGSGEWLGCVEPQYLDPAPVCIWRSIINWFRAGCRGTVPLSPDPAAIYQLMMDFCGGIVAEDESHAAELRHLPERQWLLPQITVARKPTLAPR